MHFDAQLVNVFADVAAGFDDGLMHLVLDLVGDTGGGGGDELHHVGAQRAGGGVNDLEFFFDADGEAVSHGGPSGGLSCERGQRGSIILPSGLKSMLGWWPNGPVARV